jgi:peroxiredoxin
MMKTVYFFIVPFFLSSVSSSQTTIPYRVVVERPDGYKIVFNMLSSVKNGRIIWVIRNDTEKLVVDSIRIKDDSLFIEMPFFDSRMRLTVSKDKVMTGSWIRGSTADDVSLPVIASPGIEYRFLPSKGKAVRNINGRFAVEFTKPDGTIRKSVAEFRQNGDHLTGTFLNPSGDYRYLEGIVTGDSLMLSCFDGAHAYFFGARITAGGDIVEGIFCAGIKGFEQWTAKKNPIAKVDDAGMMMYLRAGEERLNFRFPDLDSNFVSINDEKYRDKVVVIQIMGSWCPNCMDETAFLSEYYRKNKSRGVEVIGLAYEYSTDFSKSVKTLRKFQQRYQVEYPFLVTGVTTIDTFRTEKTLPQLTAIKGFPTTIFIGKDGRVEKIHPGFSGPATGHYYDEYRKDFDVTINELLKGVSLK